MGVAERFSTAIMSTNLTSDPRTLYSDSDVIGAYGLLAKSNPLGVALARLLAGGKSASAKEALVEMAIWKSGKDGRRVSLEYAGLIVDEVLAWYFFGTCQVCQGHGHPVLPGTKTLSDEVCPHCKDGKVDLLQAIPKKRHDLALWLSSQIDTSISGVGGQAMKKLLEAQ